MARKEMHLAFVLERLALATDHVSRSAAGHIAEPILPPTGPESIWSPESESRGNSDS